MSITVTRPFEIVCQYCKKGATEKDPMLFQIYTAGTYFQHWNFDGVGCDENIDNKSPAGDKIPTEPLP